MYSNCLQQSHGGSVECTTAWIGMGISIGNVCKVLLNGTGMSSACFPVNDNPACMSTNEPLGENLSIMLASSKAGLADCWAI